MFFLVFASLLLALYVLGAEDPTRICLPDEFESIVYSFSNNEAGRLIFDFTDEVLAISFPRTGRFVYNLTDETSAVLLTNNSRIGLPQDGHDTEAWEFETPDLIARAVLIRGPPAIPVLRETEIAGVTNVFFYINPSLTITDSAILTVPPVCSQAIVVG